MYIFKFKKQSSLFWKKIRAIGHMTHPESNRMDVFLEDGSIYSIGSWDKFDLSLGLDFITQQKRDMEREAGTTIPLNV